jgi:hypothetical protein
MPKETTYESEMNQPSHRPGMESVVNRGDDARDSSGTREGARRQVSPPTRSAFGADSASDPAPREAAAAPPAADDSPGAGTGGRQRTEKILGQADSAS